MSAITFPSFFSKKTLNLTHVNETDTKGSAAAKYFFNTLAILSAALGVYHGITKRSFQIGALGLMGAVTSFVFSYIIGRKAILAYLSRIQLKDFSYAAFAEKWTHSLALMKNPEIQKGETIKCIREFISKEFEKQLSGLPFANELDFTFTHENSNHYLIRDDKIEVDFTLSSKHRSLGITQTQLFSCQVNLKTGQITFENLNPSPKARSQVSPASSNGSSSSSPPAVPPMQEEDIRIDDVVPKTLESILNGKQEQAIKGLFQIEFPYDASKMKAFLEENLEVGLSRAKIVCTTYEHDVNPTWKVTIDEQNFKIQFTYISPDNYTIKIVK